MYEKESRGPASGQNYKDMAHHNGEAPDQLFHIEDNSLLTIIFCLKSNGDIIISYYILSTCEKSPATLDSPQIHIW